MAKTPEPFFPDCEHLIKTVTVHSLTYFSYNFVSDGNYSLDYNSLRVNGQHNEKRTQSMF